ncbi:ectonucleotide pyrophosphatase/phosphodiesterase [Asticcacaulis sp. BYS171W]|uniref:Ectonucleotide pyrophosphatase/phosphodiesterase n=1 Tax=Asticcacaulis aquaticus TaxID=2984212 RepID=A0ABT5HQF6_9CAUL|nr:ectonucleotide pyrophosphatase/phosphodiesterase [Asticcacaulis aquaticus]MDC7682302.1 ectonucleotide pyrophosphatase/phosphodiesterase [Asticcacaulis aquaticus]
MRAAKLWISGLFLLLLSACATVPMADRGPPNTLILISIDGWRADYMDRDLTPNLKYLADNGATGAMRPSFPSLTFPNHYTLVTGMRPDHHGIVGNTMRDARKPGVTFKLSNNEAVTDGFWWNDAKPFWVSAREQGMVVATMFWPGSEAEIHGLRPSLYSKFEDHVPPLDVVTRGMAWMDVPEAERPRALTLYFSDVDHAGHDFGPDAPEVDTALKSVDAAIGYLIADLQKRGLWGKVNLIIVGDHGMTKHRPETFIKIADLLPQGIYELVPSGQIAGFNYVKGHEAELDAILLKPHAHMTCWPKAKIPAKFHYGTHVRVPAIVCLANPGSYIVSPSKDNWMPKPQGGSHGYDPYETEMATCLIAFGPDIRAGVRLDTFDNVAVYPLVMHLLRLKAEKSDGRIATLTPVLRQ